MAPLPDDKQLRFVKPEERPTMSPKLARRTAMVGMLALGLFAILFFVMLMSIKELSSSLFLYTENSEVLSVLTFHYMDSGDYQVAAAIGA